MLHNQIAPFFEHLDLYHGSNGKDLINWRLDRAYLPDEDVSYDALVHSFECSYNSIEDWAYERKKCGLSTNVADFFGSDGYKAHIDVLDSLTCLRLEKPDGEVEIVPKQEVIFGSAYDTAYWDDLLHSMVLRNISNFDLITIRPGGHFQILSEGVRRLVKKSPDIFEKAGLALYRLLNAAYSVLSDKSGLMFVQVPELIFTEEMVLNWVKHVNDKNMGTYVTYKTKRDTIFPFLEIKRTNSNMRILPDFDCSDRIFSKYHEVFPNSYS